MVEKAADAYASARHAVRAVQFKGATGSRKCKQKMENFAGPRSPEFAADLTVVLVFPWMRCMLKVAARILRAVRWPCSGPRPGSWNNTAGVDAKERAAPAVMQTRGVRMSRAKLMLALAALTAMAPAALAGGVNLGGSLGSSGQISGSVGGSDMTGFTVDGFTTRDDLGGSVKTDDPASFSLPMYGSNGSKVYINTGGASASVKINTGFTSIGENRNGQLINGSRGNILVSWDEQVLTNKNVVTVLYMTSDGQDIMPSGVMIGNETFDFWTWNVGVVDPINFQSQDGKVPLYAATVSLSRDSGDSFYSTKSIFNKSVSSPWGGKDGGVTQIEVGQGVNYIRLRYEVGQVPGPSTGVLMGMGVLAAARRRRR